MSVTDSNTVLLDNGNIRTALVAAGSSGRNFILTEDIILTGEWTPVGTGAASFQGKFYGNGHTVTFDTGSGFANTAYTGLFGYVSDANAEIRDLTVRYAADAAAWANTTRIGGLAGLAGDGAKLRNIIVTGASGKTLRFTGGNNVCFGGIAGELNGSETLLDNVYSNLNISLSSTATTTKHAGGV
jgi:hypothetical protein